jgi:hypothetical protein
MLAAAHKAKELWCELHRGPLLEEGISARSGWHRATTRHWEDNSAIMVEERYVTEINMSTGIDNFSKKFVPIIDFLVLTCLFFPEFPGQKLIC